MVVTVSKLTSFLGYNGIFFLALVQVGQPLGKPETILRIPVMSASSIGDIRGLTGEHWLLK
jgi:hypothetical protein